MAGAAPAFDRARRGAGDDLRRIGDAPSSRASGLGALDRRDVDPRGIDVSPRDHSGALTPRADGCAPRLHACRGADSESPAMADPADLDAALAALRRDEAIVYP